MHEPYQPGEGVRLEMTKRGDKPLGPERSLTGREGQEAVRVCAGERFLYWYSPDSTVVYCVPRA